MRFNAEAQRAQSSMPRRTSVVEWDGQPGRMPPRMGAWQPERLRYGAATKNQRVAERFPERKQEQAEVGGERGGKILRASQATGTSGADCMARRANQPRAAMS